MRSTQTVCVQPFTPKRNGRIIANGAIERYHNVRYSTRTRFHFLPIRTTSSGSGDESSRSVTRNPLISTAPSLILRDASLTLPNKPDLRNQFIDANPFFGPRLRGQIDSFRINGLKPLPHLAVKRVIGGRCVLPRNGNRQRSAGQAFIFASIGSCLPRFHRFTQGLNLARSPYLSASS